jgi:hypothetical protein
LSEESCASETAVSSTNETIRDRIRTPLLYRDASGETGALARPHKRPQKSQAAHMMGRPGLAKSSGEEGKLIL